MDNAGNRTAKQNWLTGVTENYSYDALYQLTQVLQGANATESYSYDKVGNRLSSLGLGSWSYNSSNQLTSTPTATYTYDYNGNTTSKTDANGTTGYGWDYENRLTSVTLPGAGGVVTFTYDPFGRRIQKSSAAGTVNYVYDGANLVAEVDALGNAVAAYAQGAGIDEPLAMWRAGATSYYQADGLGSITSLANAAGVVSATYTYDAFGNLTNSAGDIVNPFRYTGREWDQETGLYHYRARYYDPVIGRFLSEDPIDFDGGINFHSYVENNPANLVYPSGYSPCLDIGKFVKALDRNAEIRSTGWCGRYVWRALREGGLDVGSHKGKDFGPYLLGAGFSQLSPNGYRPQAGDVAVFQPYPSGNPAGHVQGFDGTHWVSDFVQPYPATAPGGIYPNKGYRLFKSPYTIYRPTPCATSPAEEGLFQRVVNWVKSFFQ